MKSCIQSTGQATPAFTFSTSVVIICHISEYALNLLRTQFDHYPYDELLSIPRLIVNVVHTYDSVVIDIDSLVEGCITLRHQYLVMRTDDQ